MAEELSPFYREKIVRPNILKNYQRQFPALILLNKAYGQMLTRRGLLAPEDYRKLARGLDQVRRELKETDMDGQKGDLYYNAEAALNRAVGQETARKLHLGRSRADIYAALTRLEIRESLLITLERVHSLEQALLREAAGGLDTIIPFYSYGQPAQPGTWGHYLLALQSRLARDVQRLEAAYANTNQSPLGAAAGIGTSFAIDRQMLCQLLGFDKVMENTLDAVCGVDYLLESEAALALMMSGLSRTAADLFYWAGDEVGILDFDLSIATGSSIMPQKKNPAGIESIRSKSCHAAGLLMDGLMACRGTSLFPVRDNWEMTFLYWENLGEALGALGMLEEALAHSRPREGRACQRAAAGFTGATALAEFLAADRGISFAEAHSVIGAMIRRLMAAGQLSPANMTGQLLREVSLEKLGRPIDISDGDIARALDPRCSLAAKVSGGTPKREDSEALLAGALAGLSRQRAWLSGAREKIQAAYRQVEEY